MLAQRPLATHDSRSPGLTHCSEAAAEGTGVRRGEDILPIDLFSQKWYAMRALPP